MKEEVVVLEALGWDLPDPLDRLDPPELLDPPDPPDPPELLVLWVKQGLPV